MIDYVVTCPYCHQYTHVCNHDELTQLSHTRLTVCKECGRSIYVRATIDIVATKPAWLKKIDNNLFLDNEGTITSQDKTILGNIKDIL